MQSNLGYQDQRQVGDIWLGEVRLLGEVRKVGISGDGRRSEVEGGFTVKEWNRVS